MNVHGERAVADLVSELEKAWNAADGAAFGRPFAEDADFVNIRGEHFRTREPSRRDTRASSIRFTRAALSVTRWAECERSRRRSYWPT